MASGVGREPIWLSPAGERSPLEAPPEAELVHFDCIPLKNGADLAHQEGDINQYEHPKI